VQVEVTGDDDGAVVEYHLLKDSGQFFEKLAVDGITARTVDNEYSKRTDR